MKQIGREEKNPAKPDDLVREITVGATGDDAQFRAFEQAFRDHVKLPADGFVIGEPISVTRFDYDGNPRLGLTALCRREDGSGYVVTAADVMFPEGSEGARYLSAYRRWIGLDSVPSTSPPPAISRRQHKATADDLDLFGPVELIALTVKATAARCRLPGSERVVTLRTNGLWDVVPGEILRVRPRKQWTYAGHPYLSGEIESARLDVSALGLLPLRLEQRGTWEPSKEYWGEKGEPIPKWAKPIIAHGPRPAFEMEQVLPGEDPNEPDEDPILRSNDLKEGGDYDGAYKILMELCRADLRCLDAHAHLGNFCFDRRPQEAIRSYEVGLRIGELSLGEEFEGVLPWGYIDNRPFLRCMQGFGLCLWRLGRFEEAVCVFDRMLWLNPSDNQGVRFLIGEVQARKEWKE